MIELYTLELMQQQNAIRKKSIKQSCLVILLLLITSLPLVVFRNTRNHFPSIVLLSLLWTLGTWWIITNIFIKILPCKYDILFFTKLQKSEKKNIWGLITDCSKEITIHGITCHIVEYQTKDTPTSTHQVYLDKRFYNQIFCPGAWIHMKIAQHFICAYENGGRHE